LKTKYFIPVIIVLFAGRLKAQNRLQQIAIGAGAGFATAYAGAQQPETKWAWFGDAGYYVTPYFNIDIQGQAGTLGGTSITIKNPKSFSSSYRAATAEARVQLGQFFDPHDNRFLIFAKNIYVGAGYGFIRSDINNVALRNQQTIDHVKSNIPMVPVKLGYEFNLVNNYGEPLIKADFSYSFNYTIGKGLDGYYDNTSKSFNFYNYYAFGLKYLITIGGPHKHSYDKFD